MKITFNGVVHTRIDGKNGAARYYYKGKLHREDGGPAVLTENKDYFWYKHGYRHREDGPAEEYASGANFWYKNGYLHREDGPACEYPDGTKYWYKNGCPLTEEQFKEK